MTTGIPYDSPEAMAFAGCVTAIMTAESYRTSAEMAKNIGSFMHYEKNKEDMLRVIKNHRRAAFNAKEEEYEKLPIKPMGIDPQYAPAYLLAAAREVWNDALAMGEMYGYRNAQTTLLAPTGTTGLLMDCATTGVEPDFALVKFKKLAGGGYFKIVNESVPVALKSLGYSEKETDEIINYLKGHGTLVGAPGINHEKLLAKGFANEDILKIEKVLPSVFELPFAFNAWTLGELVMKRLGFAEDQYLDSNFNMLSALGFTNDELSQASEYVCGAMTIEGAPHLKKEHYRVFDTANRNGKKGQRYIHYLGHIRMMAAVQPFLSGAISKTINMPNEATVEDVKIAYMASWKLGLKANAIYRDGCKLSQPLVAKSKDGDKKEDVKVEIATAPQKEENKYTLSSGAGVMRQDIDEKMAQIKYAHDGTNQGMRIYIHGEQRKLPYKRSGITIKTKVAGQKIFLRTGEYPDGKLGEVFIDMYREGAAFRSLLNLFAISISTGLQYGVPLEEYVDKFTFTRFDPSGLTDHPNVRSCTSIIDFVFRVLGMEYLGRMDFVQVKPSGIQKNRAEQMSRLAAEARGQKVMPLDDSEIEKETIILKDYGAKESQMSLPNMPKAKQDAGQQVAQTQTTSSADQLLAGMMGDAPPCPTCGHITIRNGSCYKCLNCGSTTGCS
jgi:ribonucleoside-diphosphate reductase alpha chain